MARQQVNIGVEGNDGTGDSIRESFRKVNENFQELYAVFGIGGQISFTSLSDTFATYEGHGNKLVAVKNDELGLEPVQLASNGALTGNSADDTILFNYSEDGKIIVSTAFNNVQSDTEPQLGGPLDANSFGIGKAAVTEAAAQALSNKYGEDFTIEDLVITKRHGGESYLKRGKPGAAANLRDEPSDATEYTFTIGSFNNTEVTITGHGLDSGSNGSAYQYSSTGVAATNLVNNNTYYIRIINGDKVSLHNSSVAAKNNTGAINITGGSGTQTLTDLAYDSDIPGFWADSEALPRKSVVRRQGDNMEGALNLSDHPGDLAGQGTPNGSDDLQAATKYYVDNARYESTTNLYVNQQGTDSQLYTPPGKEGRSQNFAFKSINRACEEAEILQEASPYEPGPYMQTVQYGESAENSKVTTAAIKSIVAGREPVAVLIEENKEFLQAEVTAYIAQTYPDLVYETDTCARDVGLMLDSVVLDTLSGNNANYLSRWAGIRYYSSPSAKKAITTQGTETLDAINYLATITDLVLRNSTVTALQSDVTQTIDVTQVVDSTGLASVAAKFTIITDTIESGPLDAPVIVDGSFYQLAITNGNFGFVDQGDPGNTDLLPGKLVVGKQSGAKGIIVQYRYEADPLTTTPSGNDELEVRLVEPIEFIAGEEIEFGNTVRGNQISIMVETGIYYEDFPIKVPANVSIVGDEFRRTLIRPKRRSSQSRFADIYFYRDKEFDGLTGDSSSVTGFPDTNLPYTGTEYVNPLTSNVDGYFGFHYLLDPTHPRDIDNNGVLGKSVYNRTLYTDGPELLELNKDFIIEETIQYINANYPSLSYNESKCRRDTGLIIDGLIHDLTFTGREKSLENQTAYYIGAVAGQETETEAAIVYIKTIANDVLSNQPFAALGSVPQVIDVTKTAEVDTSPGSKTNVKLALNSLVDLVAYAFDADYNPAKNNLEMDAFLMNDATRMTGLTVQGHGGFMCVLDPEGQVLTKSPYIQVGSSFSQSINRQAFRGGQMIDAFCANIPMNITAQDDPFTLSVASDPDEGLFYKKPQTPCPYYIDGNRFQVNAVTEWDPVLGTAKLILDRTSNGGSGMSGTTNTLLNVDLESYPLAITVQTGGNRSMLGNDFTQINDLGYGLVVVNGGLCEQVSQFTYYCHTSYYAKNGAEIRSLNGSNAYGNYGLVAEGADPNEIPDAVVLKDNMIQPLKTAVAEITLELDNATSFDLYRGNTLTQSTGATGTVAFDAAGAFGTKVYLKDVSGTWNTTGTIAVALGTGSSLGTITGTTVPTEVQASAVVNTLEQLSVNVYDASHPIQNRGELEIYHASELLLGRYEASNIARQDGIIVDGVFGLTDSVSGVTDNSVSGTGAAFTVGKTSDNGYKVYAISGTGSGYLVGETIVISGELFGGATPANDCTITIDTVSDSGVVQGVSATGTVLASSTTPRFDGQMIRVNFATGTAGFSQDGLLSDLDEDVLVIHRMNGNFVFDEIADADELIIRPSTAVVFDESVETTYRSISFQAANSTGESLEDDQALTGFDINYDYVRLIVSTLNTGNTTPAYINGGTSLGATEGDLAIAVLPLTEDNEKNRLNNGDMIFGWNGKIHQIDSYVEPVGETFAYITISDIAGGDIISPARGTGLRGATSTGIELGTNTVTIRAGLPANAPATITVNISTCRATGHDFLDIGTGGFNTSNYPNVLLGLPRTPDQSKETEERSKGRVFFVSTDQDGIFRVGKFFVVDQGTGTVTFSASIALSNLDGIGFKRGVVVAEFSTDDGMVNNAPDTVPVQSAVRGYVNRRLGFDHVGDTVSNIIGPGVVALDGSKTLTGPLNLGSNAINNISTPTSDSDAANKGYVDGRIGNQDSYEELRNTLTDAVTNSSMPSVDEGQLLVTTGKKRVFLDGDTIGGIGSFTAGQNFTAAPSGATGTVVQAQVGTDDIYGNVVIVVYTATAGVVTDTDVLSVTAGPTGTVLDGPFDEIANGTVSSSNDIDITVNRSETSAELELGIAANSIVNADVNASAAIAQSKLNMQAASTRANATGITQSDLGLASFDSDDFEVTNGWVAIKANSLDFNDLPQIATNKALGNVSGSTGDIAAIDITTTGAADSLVRTQSDGGIRVDNIKLGGADTYEILSLTGTRLDVKTPGQATVFTAQGTDSSMIIEMPGSLDIGNADAAEGYYQNNNATYNDQSRLAVDWIYAKVIEDNDEKTIASTGIAIGANTGFTSAGQVGIFVKDGTTDSVVPLIVNKDRLEPDTDGIYDIGTSALRYDTIYANNLNLAGNVTLGDATGDSITIGARFSSALVPDTNNSYDIGTDTLRWQDVFGVTGNFTNITYGGTALTATATELNYVDGVTSAIQTQINTKFPTAGGTITGNFAVNGNTTLGSDSTDTITFNGETNSIIPDGNNTRTLGDSGNVWNAVYATLFEGVATSAKYADLAEMYLANKEYEPGTVLVFGGEAEVIATQTKGDRRVAGVVSENPAHLMNSALEGDHPVAIALQGRVPCKVLGKVKKGDLLVTSAIPGYAIVDNNASVGTVIGKALEDKDSDDRGVIEVVVGRV